LLRIPVNTVRSRLFRARLALRNHLQAEPSQPLHARPLGGTRNDEARDDH